MRSRAEGACAHASLIVNSVMLVDTFFFWFLLFLLVCICFLILFGGRSSLYIPGIDLNM